MEIFDYIKIGSFKASLGGLQKTATNPKMYKKPIMVIWTSPINSENKKEIR